MNLYILCLLVIAELVDPEIIHRLSTKEKSTLNENDYIYSTLGQFRMRLISPSCQIRIQEFNVIDYEVKGYFPYDPFLVPCSLITIQSGVLKTQQQVPLIKIKNFQALSCRQTTLTINDMGVIILTCIIYDEKSINQQQVKSESQWVTAFRTLNRFLYPVLKATVTTNDVLQLKSNDGGWGFSSRNGEFRIFYMDDPRKIAKFRYHGFQLGPGKILDKSGFGDIFFSIDGFNYQERCSIIKYRQFNYPLVFVMNKFWPELRVLDQGGYQLMSFRYPNYNCRVDLGINPIQYQRQCISWFCPEGTFQFQGDCVLKCPSPYFHQIKINLENRCVLNCQEGSFVDEKERVCSCNEMIKIQKCETPSKSYALGCYCQKSNQEQLFYNGFSCLNTCSLGYIQLSLAIQYNSNDISKRSTTNNLIPTRFGGVCIKCPYKCLVCRKYSIPVNYLECIECMNGYTLFEGFCKKQCKLDNFPNSNIILINSSQTNKINTTKNNSNQKNLSKVKSQKNSLLKCLSKCQIQYCEVCQLVNSNENIKSTVSMTSNNSSSSSFEEKQVCRKCDRPYILHNNACIKKCPSEYIMRVTSTLHLECEKLQKCQQRYPNRNASQIGDRSILQISILSADPLEETPPPESPPLAKKLKSSQIQSSSKYVHGIYSSTIIVNQKVNYTSCTQCKLEPYGICWINCDKSSYFNNQSSCYCYVGYDSTYNHRYGFKSSCMLEYNQSEAINITNAQKQCPYNYYLYKQTLECLSCPFGCLTCMHDSYGVIWCTSCGPSYYLKINLNTFVGYICQRDSSLVSCENTTQYTFYDSQNKVCTSITENNKTVYNKAGIANKSNEQIISELIGLYAMTRLLCRKNDPYCLICLEYETQICTFCIKGYYLYNQKCYKKCPEHTMRYQRVCIKIDIVLPHCKKAQVKENVYLMNISQINMNQEGYLYFARPLTIGLDLVIDPIGNPLNYISIHGRDIGYRIGQYPYPVIQCMQCNEFYGMNPQTLICESCQQQNCLHCPSSLQNICFKCTNDYKLDENNRCIEKKEEQKNCNHDEYRNDEGICRKECKGFISAQKEERQRVINCTKYCNTNSDANKFYEILEDKTKSTLICKQKANKVQGNVLNLAGTHFHLARTVLMLVLVPVESRFMRLSDFDSGFVGIGSVSQVTKSYGKNIYQQLPPNSIHFIEVNEQVIRIIVQLSNQTSIGYFYAISLNVSSLYGSASDVSTQKSRRMLKQQVGDNQLLHLSQSEYVFTDETQAYSDSLQSSISKSFQVLTIFSIILAILFMAQQMLYKLENMFILMQTLPLILISINIRQLDRSLYQLFYGFRWTIGAYYNNYQLNQVYVQQSYSTGQILLIKDANVITNCLPYLIVLLILALFYFCIGILCMQNQFLVFWRRARSDRKLSTMSHKQKVKQMQKQAEAQKIRKNEINKKMMDRFYREEQVFTLKQYTNRKTTSKQNRNSNETLSYHYSMREKQREYSSITNLPKQGIRKNKKIRSQIKQKQKSPPLKNDHRFLDVASNVSPIQPIKSQMIIQKQPLLLHEEQSLPRRIINCIKQFISGNQYHKYDPKDINHEKKLRILLVFIFQASLIVFIYFSILTLIAPMKYPSRKQNEQNIFEHRQSDKIMISAFNFHLVSKIVSVILLALSFSYAIYKVFSDPIGALYVWKRVLFGLVLALLMGHSLRILGCALIQIIFTIFRVTIQELPFVKINQTSRQAKTVTALNTGANTGANAGDKSLIPQAGLATKIDSKVSERIQNMLNATPSVNMKKEEKIEKEKSNILLGKLNKMHMKIRNSIHPYKCIISIIIEQLLLILVYVLLAFTDTFAAYRNQTDNNFTNIIVIAIITIVICSYLVAFCVQLSYVVIDNWYLSSLTHHQQIRKIRLWQYYQQYKNLELPLPSSKSPYENNDNIESSRTKNTDNTSYRATTRQNKSKHQLNIDDKYIEYYNEFMYRVYEDNEWMFLENQQQERLLEQEQNYKDFYTAHRYADSFKVNVSPSKQGQPVKKYETVSLGSSSLGNKNVNMKNKQTFIFGRNKTKNRFSRPDQNFNLEPVNRLREGEKPKSPSVTTKYKQG